MSLPEDEGRSRRGSAWFRASTSTQYVTVRSRVAFFLGHWSPKLGGSVRCLNDLCPICAAGDPPRPFYYIAVTVGDDQLKIFEIPRRHRDLAEELDKSESGGIGFQLAILKEGKARNSPILITVCGFEESYEFDVWPFVQSLGRSLVPLGHDAVRPRAEPDSESVPNQHADSRAM